jgi:hypothetical protein
MPSAAEIYLRRILDLVEAGFTTTPIHIEIADEDQKDAITGAMVSIEVIHHEVHEGEMFYAEHVNTNVANAVSLDILITTGAKYDHIVFNLGVGGQTLVYLYEGPNASGGTSVPIYNMNRPSANAPLSIVTHTPSVVATGSVALVNGRLLAGGTSPQTRVGAGVRAGTEFILKPSTKYLIRATNNSGAGIAINIALEFYEEAVNA